MANIHISIKNRLRGAVCKGERAVRIEIRNLMNQLPHERIQELYKLVKLVAPAASRKLLPNARADYNSIFPVVFSPPSSATSELLWSLAIIVDKIDIIKSFIECRNKIEKIVLMGNYNEAILQLNELDNTYGKSLWALEIRFALIQELEGLKSNKELAKKLTERMKPSLLSFIIHQISVRNEEKSTVGRLVKVVDDSIEHNKIPSSISAYLKYRLLYVLPENESEIAAVLSVDKYSSLIDCYETLVSILMVIGADKKSFKDVSCQYEMIIDKVRELNDSRIRCLYKRYGNNTKLEANEFYDSSNMSAEYIYKKARENDSLHDKNSLFNFIVEELRPIICRDINRDKNANILFKKLLNFKSLSIIIPLSSIVFRKCTRYESDKLHPELYKNACLNIAKENSLLSLNAEGVQSYHDDDNVEMKPFGINEFSYEDDLEAAYKCIRDKDYESAISYALKNIDDENKDLHWESRRVLTDAYVFSGRTKEAIEATAEYCSDNPLFSSELPIEEMLKGRKWKDIKEYDLKSLAVCLNVYCDHYRDDNAHFNLKQCVTQIYKTGIRDDIISRATAGSKLNAVEIEILRKILIGDNLTLVSNFSSSEELENERLYICQALLKVDPEYIESYEDEIKEISFQMAMNLGMQKVDQSRVYVDFSGIKRWAEKEHKETFSRWTELSAIDSSPVPDVRAIMSKLLENVQEIPAELLVKPTSQADQLLLEILESLLNRFLNDPKDGLNSYLSLRVRHGSLEGFLRSPFNEEGLLTEFDQESCKHILPEKLLYEIPHKCSNIVPMLEEILGNFSQNFNSCLAEFVTKKLRIKSDLHPEGLVDIRVTSAIFNLIKLDLIKSTSIENLLDYSMAQFVIWTNYQLETVRNELMINIRAKIESSIEQLRNDFNELPDKDSLVFLRDKINRGYLSFQKAVEKAADWFQFKPIEDYSRTFSVSEVMEIAIQMTRNVCPGFDFDAQLKIEGEFPLLSIETLNIITDILVIVLGNVHKHSDVSGQSKIEINLKIEDELLMVTVNNPVNKSVINDENKNKVREIRNKILTGDHINLLPTEGGTGLIKLSRLIPSDQGPIDKYLKFDFTDNNMFTVFIAMPFRIIQKN